MFTKIKTKNRHRILKNSLILSLVLVFLLFPEIAGAANVLNETTAKITSVFKIFLDVISLLLWPVLLMIGGLMQNDIIFGGGMEDRLRIIWVEVRNIVNIFFVIGILGLAFYNVLGIGEDKIKSVLPKLIIAIIAVNFTFLASKVVLDVANVLTVSVFSIPQSVDPTLAKVLPEDNTGLRDQFEAGICRSLYDPVNGGTDSYIQTLLAQQAKIDAKKFKGKDGKPLTGKSLTTKESDLKRQYAPASTPQYEKVKSQLICTDLKLDFSKIELGRTKNVKDPAEKRRINKQYFLKLFDKFDANNAALAMALNLQKVYAIKQVNISGNLDKLALNLIFSTVLYIIYGTAYIALFAILIVRIIVIWIAIVFSPLLIFSSKVGAPNIPGISENADKLLDSFIKHVQAPIIIGAVMSIGFIMLRSFQGTDINVGFFELSNKTLSIPTSGLDTFKEFLIAVATCAVVWMGVFAAAEGTLAAGFTGALKSGIERFGKWVLKSPQYLPLVPIKKIGEKGEQEKVPLASVLRGFGSLPTEIENRLGVYDKSQKFVKDLLGAPTTLPPAHKATSPDQLKRIIAKNGKSITKVQVKTSEFQNLPKNPHFKTLLSVLKDKKERDAIVNAINRKEALTYGGTTAADKAWTKMINQNKINEIDPNKNLSTQTKDKKDKDKTPTGTSKTDQALYGKTKNLIHQQDNDAAIRAGLSGNEQTAYDKLKKAAGESASKFDEAYKNIDQATRDSLKKKISAIQDTFSTGAIDNTQSESGIISGLKRYAEKLQAGGVAGLALRKVLRTRLEKVHKSSTTAKLSNGKTAQFSTLLNGALNSDSGTSGNNSGNSSGNTSN